MLDFLLYRVLPVLFLVFLALLAIPRTSVPIMRFVTDLYVRF